MSDELAAFFAKKTSKTKKKGVINLQEIGEQLEKRVQEQKDETEDVENKTLDENNSKNRGNNDTEDSEWLDFDEKPSIPIAVKELADIDGELEDEKKRSSAEPTRTWNIADKEGAEVGNTAQKERKFVPRAQKAPLDLTSEEMFPSIEMAPEIEIKLKAQEEEKRKTDLEERKRQEEEKAKKENVYRPRRPAEGEGRMHADREINRRQPNEPAGPTEEESTGDWRSMQKTPSKAVPQIERTVKSPERLERNTYTTDKVTNEDNDWRASAKPKTEEETERKVLPTLERPIERNFRPAEDDGNWRNKPTPSKNEQEIQRPTQPPPCEAQTQPIPKETTKKAYVPPHLRGK